MAEFRLGICGCAGTGKTTLAVALSKELGLEFLPAKVITQIILDRDGFVYGSGTQIERFLAHSNRQEEILQKTITSQKLKTSFVTDRTAIDLTAYAVCELYDCDLPVLAKIHTECRNLVSWYTHLFVCPWVMTMVDNERRTLNPWYQFMIHVVERGVLDDWGVPYNVLEETGLERRVKEVRNILGV